MAIMAEQQVSALSESLKLNLNKAKLPIPFARRGAWPAMDQACEKSGCLIPANSGASASKECCALNQLGIGACGRVIAVAGEPDLKRRLLEMGFCNGAAVEVIRRAPLGDPIEFKVRGYYLSLRNEQARHVQVNVSR